MHSRLLTFTAASLLLLMGCKKSRDAKLDETTDSASNAVLLKVQWPIGACFIYRSEVKRDMQLPVPANSALFNEEKTCGLDYSVTLVRERPDGGVDIDMEFLTANISMSRWDKENFIFDSRKKANSMGEDSAVRIFDTLPDKRIRFYLGVSNNVERVDGVQDLTERLVRALVSHVQPNLIRASKLFDDRDHLILMLCHGLHLPSQSVKPGATWQSGTDIITPLMCQARRNLTYTFKGWEQHDDVRCAIIEFTGNITRVESEEENPFTQIILIKGGQCSGRAWVDPVRGRIIETTIRQTLQFQTRIQMHVPGNASPLESDLSRFSRITEEFMRGEQPLIDIQRNEQFSIKLIKKLR